MVKYLWKEDRQYHQLAKDGKTAVCGAVALGEFGFKVIEKERPVLRSRICNNCISGRVVRQIEQSS